MGGGGGGAQDLPQSGRKTVDAEKRNKKPDGWRQMVGLESVLCTQHLSTSALSRKSNANKLTLVYTIHTHMCSLNKC